MRTHLVCLALWAALAQVDYDRHVVFDNSLANGSWYYSHSHVVAPSELDQADGKIPVDGDHFLTPPNALRLKAWTCGDGTPGWNSPARLCECGAMPKTRFPLSRRPGSR